MEAAVDSLLVWLTLPKVGLGALFVVAFVSATLIPLGSEPALYGFLQLHPSHAWQALAVATIGNTLGGTLTWWMGRAAERAYRATQAASSDAAAPNPRALRWLERWGTPACLLSWLPVVGDPLCAVAGWLRLPFWPCQSYIGLGKGLRYLFVMAAALRF